MNRLYEDLASAIIIQAVKDWRKAVKTLKKRPWYGPAKQMKEECERFFRSQWFAELTDVDGNFILRKLEQEAGIDDDQRVS